ncbi:hypothetical protein ABEV34_11970 [Methylorubrum rhodesianum]|uniref:hypothetical protein n=1 Tax=Methylorubrum rhodesianum TaxID=29427 RepID=UPI003D2D14A0
MAQFSACEETVEGSRLATQCLYPSFEPVYVYVAKFGFGYKIHDGGGAFRSAWLHGREENLINRIIDQECRRFHAKRAGTAISIDVEDADWLPTAVLSVANASSLSAHAAISRIVASAEKHLVDQIERTLISLFGASHVAREVELRGKSGGKRRFDAVVNPNQENPILVNGVTAHHASVSSKYVAFSDTEGDPSSKLAVHEKPLDAEDVTLLQQVATIMPLPRLGAAAQRAGSRQALAS